MHIGIHIPNTNMYIDIDAYRYMYLYIHKHALLGLAPAYINMYI